MKKLTLLTLILIVFGLILVGCGPKVGEPVGPTLLELKDELTLSKTSNITLSLELPKYVPGSDIDGKYNHTITWESDNPDVLAVGGLNGLGTKYVTTLTQTTEVETVILTATIQLNDAVGEATKQFTITVAALIMTNYDTTLEVKGEVDGTTVEINGIISYVNEKGIFVHDATGDIYVYLGATHAYTVGTEVTVAGTKSTYSFSDNTMPQITNNPAPTITVESSSTYTAAPTTLTHAELAAIPFTDVSFYGDVVTLRGVVETSTDYNTPYILREFGGDGIVGINKYANTAAKDELAIHVGDYVEVDIIIYDYYKPAAGDNYWRGLNIETTLEVKDLPALSDAEKVSLTQEELTTEWDGKVVNADITLPTTNTYGVTISWVSNNVAISNSGVYTAPVDADATVILTATIVTPTVTDTVDVTVTAKKQASAEDLHVIINEVYGGGGNSGATLTHDFIELYNPTAADIDLTGWTIQYASATGTFNQKYNLSGTIKAGSYFLIQCAQGTGGTQALPTPDLSLDIAISGTKSKVALANDGTTVVNPTDTNIVDFVGIGVEATQFEGTAATINTDNASSVTRNNFMDTDNNSVDFAKTTPTPQNSSTN